VNHILQENVVPLVKVKVWLVKANNLFSFKGVLSARRMTRAKTNSEARGESEFRKRALRRRTRLLNIIEKYYFRKSKSKATLYSE
jgi:hypothetical protein